MVNISSEIAVFREFVFHKVNRECMPLRAISFQKTNKRKTGMSETKMWHCILLWGEGVSDVFGVSTLTVLKQKHKIKKK